MAKPTIDEQLDKILYGYSGAHAKDDGQMDFYDSEDEYGEALFAAHTEAKQALEALLTEARIDAEKKLAEEHLKNCLKTDTCEVLESARKTANRVYNEGLAQLKNKGGDSE